MSLEDECGRCRSREVLKVPSTPGDHSHIVTGDRLLHTVTLNTFVCTACGHVEQWVENKSDLKLLREEWVRQTSAD